MSSTICNLLRVDTIRRTAVELGSRVALTATRCIRDLAVDPLRAATKATQIAAPRQDGVAQSLPKRLLGEKQH